jgi:hypothetical protein
MGADARIEANVINDLLTVKAMGDCVGIEFVEVRDSHGQIHVGE